MKYENHREELAKKGVTLIRGVLSEDFIQTLLQSYEEIKQSNKPKSRQVLYTHSSPPPDRPAFSALMDQWLSPHRYTGKASTLPCAHHMQSIANTLLQEKSVLFQDLILCKQPHQAPFPWHQDFGFWPIDQPDGVILWVPLQDAGPQNGGLRFALESHTLGARPVIDLHTGKPQNQDHVLGFHEEDWSIFSPRYQKGDVVAFTPLTFHASPEMKSRGARIAWSCIFLSPSVRWKHSNAPNHPLCRHVQDGVNIQEVSHG